MAPAMGSATTGWTGEVGDAALQGKLHRAGVGFPYAARRNSLA